MDLRRIVAEVEEKKQYERALAGPPESASPPPGQGAAGSLLVAVRERMLAENPEADVGQIDEVLEPNTANPSEAAPPVARADATDGAPAADTFLERYLELSVEFEERYGIKGWADFVAKKTQGHGHHGRTEGHAHRPAKPATQRTTRTAAKRPAQGRSKGRAKGTSKGTSKSTSKGTPPGKSRGKGRPKRSTAPSKRR